MVMKLLVVFSSAYCVLSPFIMVILSSSLRSAITRDIFDLRTKFSFRLRWFTEVLHNVEVRYWVNEERIIISETIQEP